MSHVHKCELKCRVCGHEEWYALKCDDGAFDPKQEKCKKCQKDRMWIGEITEEEVPVEGAILSPFQEL